MAPPASSNIEDLWKNSDIFAKSTPTVLSQAEIAERLSSDRSAMWSNLSQLPPSDQAMIMGRLASSWPYDKERRALNWPIQLSLAANCVSSGVLASRISADMVLLRPRAGFLEAVKDGPKSPFVFGVYTSGVAFYMMHQAFITPLLYSEDRPCQSCILARSAIIGLSTGIALPMLATPFLAYYILLQRQQRFPELKNMLEVLTMCWEGSRSTHSLLKYLVPLQIAAAAISAYSEVWGRNRMFDTMDLDPDLTRELVRSAHEQMSFKEKAVEYLKHLPFIGVAVKEKAPEEERL